MDVVLVIMGVLVVCFCFVLLRGAPYVPTLKKQVATAIELAELKKGDTLLELGCGDGKVLKAAAEQGLRAVGYELNPILAAVAWLRTRKYGNKVQVHCKDFWLADWPPAKGIFVFLLDPYMQKLDTKIVQTYGKHGTYQGMPIRLLSNAFKVPGKTPVAEREGIFVYDYKNS